MNTSLHNISRREFIGKENPIHLNELLACASKEKAFLEKANQEKTLLLVIDMQNDFMDNGELGVPGAHGDVWNTVSFIYKHLRQISHIAISLDTHQPNQIFHPMWWVDKNGNHPAPFTTISESDVKKGIWKPVQQEQETLHYLNRLEKIGKKQLCVWSYHCLEGTNGAALEGQLANMVQFHSVLQRTNTMFVNKGRNPLSEMYGIISPEVEDGFGVNSSLLEFIDTFDKIIVVGEAKSHCVLESIKQIVTHLPHKGKDLIVLEDCMSSIPGFEKQTEKEFDLLEKKFHINRTKSTDLIL